MRRAIKFRARTTYTSDLGRKETRYNVYVPFPCSLHELLDVIMMAAPISLPDIDLIPNLTSFCSQQILLLPLNLNRLITKQINPFMDWRDLVHSHMTCRVLCNIVIASTRSVFRGIFHKGQ